jgi:hypothetical protein
MSPGEAGGASAGEGLFLEAAKSSDLPMAGQQADALDKRISQMAKNGACYHEPPYTWEESRDFYRALSGGPVTFVHPPVLAKTEKPKRRKSPPPPPEEWRPSLTRSTRVVFRQQAVAAATRALTEARCDASNSGH